MAKTKHLFNNDGRDKILKGVEVLYEAVSTTLGPRGQNVAIAKTTPYGDIYARDVIHDGVGVAMSIDLPDEFENLGAQILREAAQKTVDTVGDGTTLTIVLARSLLKECIKIIATGENPMALRRGLEEGKDVLIKELEKYAVPVKTLKEEIHIATISSEDPALGEMVGNILHEMGPDGVVTVEVSKSSETKVEKQTGMMFDQGYLHPLFITNPQKMEATIENPLILVTDKELNSIADMAPLLEEIHKLGRGLVIISPNIGGEALPLLIQNKLQGALLSLAVKAPSFGINMKNTLQDIAILTGATYITEDAGHKFADVSLEDLGQAEHVTSTKSETVIVGGKGNKSDIEVRVKAVKQALEEEESEFEQVKIKERLGKLTNGVAAIYVGGFTEIEMKERKERVEDAVFATRAAMKSGIVPGGETLWLKVREKLGKSLPEQILYRALEQPFDKLVSNAGFDPGEIREQLKAKQNGKIHYGFDVTDGQFKDFMQVGIVDPLLVLQTALQNSISVAIQLMTTGALIVPTETKKEDKKRGQN